MRVLFVLIALLWPAVTLAGGGNNLAVMYFKNTGSSELDPLKVGLAELMIADLHDMEGVSVVERDRLQEVLDELNLGHKAVVDPSSAAEVGRLLQAEWMIFGTYYELMGELYVSARLVSVETTEIIQVDQVNAKPRDFIELEKELAGKMRQAVLGQVDGAAPPTEPPPTEDETGRKKPKPQKRGEESATAAVTPEVVAEDADTLAAAVSFSEGLIYMDKKDVDRARDSFAKAVEQDPSLDAAKSKLASLEL